MIPFYCNKYISSLYQAIFNEWVFLFVYITYLSSGGVAVSATADGGVRSQSPHPEYASKLPESLSLPLTQSIEQLKQVTLIAFVCLSIWITSFKKEIKVLKLNF